MRDKKITGNYVQELQSRTGPGRPPVSRPCPHCSQVFTAREMRVHQPKCKLIYQQPLPAPMPEDLENQVLSPDPLQRRRQLDQQEADRIERTPR